jgi:hypothetical protein
VTVRAQGLRRWTDRLLVVGVVAFLAVAVVGGRLSSGDGASPATPAPPTNTGLGPGVPHCALRDMTMAVEVRRSSATQESGPEWARVHLRHGLSFLARAGAYPHPPHHRVATVVLRNVSRRRCYGGSAFTFTIRARGGAIIGDWDDIAWFAGEYRPGEYRTFSLPDVYTCGRPGPFAATARIDGRRALRGNLTRRQITC